jgi:hypothetical protein
MPGGWRRTMSPRISAPAGSRRRTNRHRYPQYSCRSQDHDSTGHHRHEPGRSVRILGRGIRHMIACPDPGHPALRVRGLAVPFLLAEPMASGDGCTPEITASARCCHGFEDPLDFLASTERMEQESRSLDRYADDPRESRAFHIARGSVAGPIRLPWLDAELAFFIAVNRRAGDDVALALDYRGNADNPAVAASDCWTYPGGGYLWRPVAPSVDAFAGMLGIVP